MSKRFVRAFALATAAAGFVFVERAGAALPTIHFDLRIHQTGGKEATLLNPGDSVELDLYAISNGLNATNVDDNVTWIMGSFTSSHGGLLGNLQGLTSPPPMNAVPPSGVGIAQDLDGDGDLDVGGTTPSSPGGYYLAAYQYPDPPVISPQPAGGMFVGRANFSIITPASAITAVDWSLRPAIQGLIAVFDGDLANNISNDPTKYTFSSSPVAIRSATAAIGQPLVVQGTVVNAYTVSGDVEITPNETATFNQGLNIAAGGIVSVADADLVVNQLLSVQSGGELSVGPAASILALSNVSLGSGSLLNVQLADSIPSNTFQGDGLATLAGTLDLSLLNGFVPDNDDQFVIMTAAQGITGTFDNTDDVVVVGGHQFDIVYNPTSVVLTNYAPVPEPALGGIVILTVAGMLRRRKG